MKELQRLYVSSALLVAPAVLAATGEHIGAGSLDDAEGGRIASYYQGLRGGR